MSGHMMTDGNAPIVDITIQDSVVYVQCVVNKNGRLL